MTDRIYSKGTAQVLHHKDLAAFITVPLSEVPSKALIQSKDFRTPTLKRVIPNWLPQLFRWFCCDLKVPTAMGAVHRLAPTKGKAVSEFRVNTERTMKKPFEKPPWLSLFSFTHLLKLLTGRKYRFRFSPHCRREIQLDLLQKAPELVSLLPDYSCCHPEFA